ncbi:MAG: hypothetical protein A2096_11760 [Spirochaetes bacterium GWF1_41_5]|nr:MAG: hypothetical protein A2096_11760 [Spirochaetes bacterium GWF1_41_5]HBE01751.1 hypothetical protein [Spirochaetia bacterium]
MEKNRFTSSPWGFRFYTFEKYADFMKKTGINELCVFLGDQKKTPLAFNENISKNEILQIKKILKGNRQGILELCGGGDYSVPHNIDVEMKKTRGHIDLAAELEVKIFRVFAGWINEKDITEATYSQISETLTQVGKYAGQYNIGVVVENHGGVSRTAEQMLKIFKNIKSVNVGINYDPANFRYYGEDEYAALEKLIDYIKFFHIKNVKFENGKPEYTRVQTGIIDYQKIFKKLLAVYNGYLCLEYENEHDPEIGTTDDFRYVKELYEKYRASPDYRSSADLPV